MNNYLRPVILAFITFLFVGCARESILSGQIFVVTNAQENLKLGLVGVYEISDSQLKVLAERALQKHDVALQKIESQRAQTKYDLQELSDLEQAVDRLEFPGLIVEKINKLKAEIKTRRSGLNNVEYALLESSPVIGLEMFSLLPAPKTKTDADGRFVIKRYEKGWILANAKRTVARETETFYWVNAVDKKEDNLLLSNDSLLQGSDELHAKLVSLTDHKTVRKGPTVDAASDTALWAKDSLAKIKEDLRKAVAEEETKATARAARAEAEEIEKEKIRKEVEERRKNTARLNSGPKVYDPSTVDRQPEPILPQPHPRYPLNLRRAGVNGDVLVEFIVAANGSVRDAKVINSTERDFASSALEAVTAWKFKPGQKHFQNVDVRMQVPIVFRLNEDD